MSETTPPAVRRANPGPIGLMGFGLTTVLLNLCNAGLLSLSAAVLAMGLFFGGLAQFVAGLLEYPSGNTFGMTAFVSYGAFWITLVALIALPHTGIIPASNHAMMGAYLSLWGLFSIVMFFGTLRLTRTHQFIFATLVILFFLLAFTEFTGSKVLGHIAGWEGLVCGFSAIYLAAAEILEAQFGRSILPVGKAAPKHTALL